MTIIGGASTTKHHLKSEVVLLQTLNFSVPPSNVGNFSGVEF